MKPTVTCIICTHLEENIKYLDACLKSLVAQKGVILDVILMTSYLPEQELPSFVRLVLCPPEYGWTRKINQGVKLSKPEAKFIMLLNDDVILSENAIFSLVNKSAWKPMIVNAVSNCDNGWLYCGAFIMGKQYLDKRFYAFEDLKDINSVIKHPIGYNMIIDVKDLCFYATLMTKEVWEKVGGLDPNFTTAGYDDTDFCNRAEKLGISRCIDLQTFIFHFGGRTTSLTNTQEDLDLSKNYYESKWKQEDNK